MPTLSSIAAASPFVGLFGTVWGIMQAFLRIGVEKSASLPVVAPAIGEALIATAVGLVAAIPATIAYNYVDKRIADLLDEARRLSRGVGRSIGARPRGGHAHHESVGPWAISVGRGRRGGFRDINVTPLVDVMLVLLVVFMVTAPLLTTGLRIDLPEVKAANTPVKDARLLVSITKEERVLFGEEDVTSHVDDALKNSARVQTEREIYIRADKDARYEIVAKVVAAARNSGVESLNLLVEPVIEDAPEEPTKTKAGAKAGGK